MLKMSGLNRREKKKCIFFNILVIHVVSTKSSRRMTVEKNASRIELAWRKSPNEIILMFCAPLGAREEERKRIE